MEEELEVAGAGAGAGPVLSAATPLTLSSMLLLVVPTPRSSCSIVSTNAPTSANISLSVRARRLSCSFISVTTPFRSTYRVLPFVGRMYSAKASCLALKMESTRGMIRRSRRSQTVAIL